MATLVNDAMENIFGCKTSQEARTSLQERLASVSMVHVTEFHTAQKSSESVDKFLFRLKDIMDWLVFVGEIIIDNDLIIAMLSGLSAEFEMIKIVILTRDKSMSLKDFKVQLLVAEGSIKPIMHSMTSSMAGMYVQGEGSNS